MAAGTVRAGDIPASLYTYRPAGELPGEANGRVFSLTYDQEGQRLARGDFGNSLSVFDVGENRMIWSVTGTDIHPVSLVDLWPVNALLAAQTGEDGAKILAFDWETGDRKGDLSPYDGGRNGLAFHDTLAELAWFGPDGGLFRYYVMGDEFRADNVPQHKRAPYGVAYSANGDTLYSASPDGRAVMWTLADNSPVVLHETDRALIDVATPDDDDSTRVVFGDKGGTLTVYDIGARTVLRTVMLPDGTIATLDFAPGRDDLLIAAGETQIHFIDVEAGAILHSIETGDQIWALALTGDGARMATGHESGKVRLWRRE